MSYTLKEKSTQMRKITVLKEKHESKCYYCGEDCDPSDQLLRPTIDHVVAVSIGGTKTSDNEVLACNGCNSSKGQLDINEFELMKYIRPNGSSKIDWVWEKIFGCGMTDEEIDLFRLVIKKKNNTKRWNYILELEN